MKKPERDLCHPRKAMAMGNAKPGPKPETKRTAKTMARKRKG